MAIGARLAAVDEANLVLDHAGQVNVFLIAGLLSAGGFVGVDGDPDLGALRTHLGERVAGLPQLRRVAVRDGRRHRWAEATPDLDHHVRLASAVDGITGLEGFCADLMTEPLAWDRPMWELLLVPVTGVAGIGVVLRIHHAIADGMAAVAIVQELFDGGLSGAHRVTPRSAGRESAGRAGASPLRRMGEGLQRIRVTLSGREVGSTVLLGERSAHRGVSFLDADLEALEAHGARFGATVNDALLAAVAAGYRALLEAAAEPVPARLPVSVPVALPRRGSAANRVGVMLVRLPLEAPRPDERLMLIAAQTRVEKASARRLGTLELMRGPIGARIMDRVGRRQRLVAGFVTNVPGPVTALGLAGAPLVRIWPVAVLAANVRLGVAAVSYGGRLSCGIHFDRECLPGAAFSRAMADELARLAAP